MVRVWKALRTLYGFAGTEVEQGLAEGAGAEAAVLGEEGLDRAGGVDAGEGFGEGVGEVVGDGEVEEGEEVAVAVVGVGVRGGGDDFAAEDEGVDELEELGPGTGVAEGEGVAGVVPSEEGEEEGEGFPLGGDEGRECPAEGRGVDDRLFFPFPRRRWRGGRVGRPRRSGRRFARLAVGGGGIGVRRGLPCRGRGGAGRRR